MSRLSNLLREVEAKDPQLAADLRREVEALSRRRAFGLSFERHIPETVELPGRPIRRGDKVRFLPERGLPPSGVDRRLWRVAAIRRIDEGRVADLVRRDDQDDEPETASRNADDLVVVAEFRDPIYPGLVSTGRIEHGGDKPFHTVINAENYHALQALLYTHEGKVDAIYVDPPYNSGARDWKYNNDYVDTDDAYRHSKWLAMMERRLKLAKRLLNQENAVLIVTIDEREFLRLGLLLEQVFPEARIQMVTSIINPNGTSRPDSFNRVDEYIFFVRLGLAPILREPDPSGRIERARWDTFRRHNPANIRESRPNQFYPIYVNVLSRRIEAVGEPLAPGVDRNSVPQVGGCIAVFPVRDDGTEMMWSTLPEVARKRAEAGFLRVGKHDPSAPQEYPIVGVYGGTIQDIESGRATVTGHDENGGAIIEYTDTRLVIPTTSWSRPSHNARTGGTDLLPLFIPSRSFPFPKSLYAVEDCLRMFVGDKLDACVLDFFAGSGTTAHAVMRLNRQDGGRRQSISVTNNEVSASEEAALRERGLRPGDPEWEALGICEYFTKPRIAAAVTGQTANGEPIKGDYRFTDEFPMADGFEENVEFFSMTYEALRPVAHNRSFEVIAPLLWLKAGSEGRRIDKVADDFDVADTYGVLFDLDAAHGFVSAVAEAESVRMAFIVTDDDRGFQMVCAELPAHVEPVRLYESYLTNFTINTSRD